MLCFVGDGDQKKFTKNPRHFSMQNSQANTKNSIHKILLESRQSKKRSLWEKRGLLRKAYFSREILENLESLEILENPQTVENKGKSDHFLEILDQRIAKGAGGKGPRQKSSRNVKKFFDTFRQFSRGAKIVKNRQKVSKSFSTLCDNFRAAPFFRPLLGGSD